MNRRELLYKLGIIAAAGVGLLACGGTPDALNPKLRWRNETNGDMTDAELDYWWGIAQDSIGKRPFITQVGSSVRHTPDPRAYDINPDGLRVIARFDNGGLWFPGDECTNDQCRGITDYQAYLVEYAVGFPNALDWEFSNIILRRLGYSIAR
jgi:hypothetical protein